MQGALVEHGQPTLELRILVQPPGPGLAGHQAQFDQGRQGGGTLLFGRQARKLRIEIGDGGLEVLFRDLLAVATTLSSWACRPPNMASDRPMARPSGLKRRVTTSMKCLRVKFTTALKAIRMWRNSALDRMFTRR
jgi:hypothetical protein